MMKCPHCDSRTVYVYTPIVYRYDVKEDGTIVETDSFRMIDVPDGESPSEFACRLMDEDDERIRDKWGQPVVLKSGK
jgi:hypothetical protein